MPEIVCNQLMSRGGICSLRLGHPGNHRTGNSRVSRRPVSSSRTQHSNVRSEILESFRNITQCANCGCECTTVDTLGLCNICGTEDIRESTNTETSTSIEESTNTETLLETSADITEETPPPEPFVRVLGLRVCRTCGGNYVSSHFCNNNQERVDLHTYSVRAGKMRLGFRRTEFRLNNQISNEVILKVDENRYRVFLSSYGMEHNDINVVPLEEIPENDLEEIVSYVNSLQCGRCHVCGQFTGQNIHNCPGAAPLYNNTRTESNSSRLDSYRTACIYNIPNYNEIKEAIEQSETNSVLYQTNVTITNRSSGNYTEYHNKAFFCLLKENGDIEVVPKRYRKHDVKIAPILENAMNNTIRILRIAEQQSERRNYLSNIFERQAQESISFSNDYQAFLNAYNNRADLYQYVDATDKIGDRKFGIEIEIDGNFNIYSIIHELREAGLTHQDSILPYHCSVPSDSLWRIEEDATVQAEIISPILSDTQSTWSQLVNLTEIIKRNGGIITPRCGGHIHVSTDDYGENSENYFKLLNLAKAYDDELFRLAQNPDYREHRGFRYCSPNIFATTDNVRTASQLRRLYGTRGAINFSNASGSPNDHVEFRLWDGSLKPEDIQTRIKLSLAMVNYGIRKGTPSAEILQTVGTSIGSHVTSGRDVLNEESTRGFRELVDKIFCRYEDKCQAAKLFAKTNWQPTTPRGRDYNDYDDDDDYDYDDDDYDDDYDIPF